MLQYPLWRRSSCIMLWPLLSVRISGTVCSLASGHLPNVSRVTPPFPSLPFLPPISNISHGMLFRVCGCVRETFLQYCTKCVNVHLFVLYSAGQLNYFFYSSYCTGIDVAVSVLWLISAYLWFCSRTSDHRKLEWRCLMVTQLFGVWSH